MVASCFGNAVSTGRQLYKLIDSIYDAVTLVSQEDNGGMSHNRFIQRLVSLPELKEYILVIDPERSSMESTKNLLDAAGMSDDSGVDEIQATSSLFDSALAEQDTTTTLVVDQSDVASQYTP